MQFFVINIEIIKTIISLLFSEKFGLFSVNMTSIRKERTPKKSAEFMRNLIERRTIPDI